MNLPPQFLPKYIMADPGGYILANMQWMWEELAKVINLNTAQQVVVRGTHAERLSDYPAAGQPLGTLFEETDRRVLYLNETVAGANTWTLVVSVMADLLANRPSDLGADDVGFRFFATDKTYRYRWTGSVWVEDFELTDAVTAGSTNLLTLVHHSSGTPAAGFGADTRVRLDNDANDEEEASAFITLWSDPTAGSETSTVSIWTRTAGASLAQVFSADNAAVVANGLLAWFSSTANLGIFLHANSAQRVYTFADADGNIVYATASLTNNNFLLGGGGALVKDSGFAIVPPASGGTGVAYDIIAARIALLLQTATLGPTTIASVGTQFLFSYTLQITTADAGSAATVQVSIGYTDSIGATTQVGALVAVIATNRDRGSFVIMRNTGNLTYTVTVTGAIGTAQFAFHATLQRFS